MARRRFWQDDIIRIDGEHSSHAQRHLTDILSPLPTQAFQERFQQIKFHITLPFDLFRALSACKANVQYRQSRNIASGLLDQRPDPRIFTGHYFQPIHAQHACLDQKGITKPFILFDFPKAWSGNGDRTADVYATIECKKWVDKTRRARAPDRRKATGRRPMIQQDDVARLRIGISLPANHIFPVRIGIRRLEGPVFRACSNDIGGARRRQFLPQPAQPARRFRRIIVEKCAEFRRTPRHFLSFCLQHTA